MYLFPSKGLYKRGKELYTNRFKISIDDVDHYESNATIVCGDINISDAKKVAVTLIKTQSNKTYGVFETQSCL